MELIRVKVSGDKNSLKLLKEFQLFSSEFFTPKISTIETAKKLTQMCEKWLLRICVFIREHNIIVCSKKDIIDTSFKYENHF